MNLEGENHHLMMHHDAGPTAPSRGGVIGCTALHPRGAMGCRACSAGFRGWALGTGLKHCMGCRALHCMLCITWAMHHVCASRVHARKCRISYFYFSNFVKENPTQRVPPSRWNYGCLLWRSFNEKFKKWCFFRVFREFWSNILSQKWAIFSYFGMILSYFLSIFR